MELNELISMFLATSLTSITFTGVFIWLIRNWISERLRRSIQYEYDMKLAKHNTELKRIVDKEADRLRFATSSINEMQKATIEKTLIAVDELWSSVLAVKEASPNAMLYLDILVAEEYKTIKDKPEIQKSIHEISENKLTEMAVNQGRNRDRMRPYINHYLWALLYTYQAVVGRITLLLHWSLKDESKLYWHEDAYVNTLIGSALSKKEYEEYQSLKLGKIGWLQNRFEEKLLQP